MMPDAGAAQREEPRDRALRLAIYQALRDKRHRVKLITQAIYMAGWEGNMQGRIHPGKQGYTVEKMAAVGDAFIGAAARSLRGDHA